MCVCVCVCVCVCELSLLHVIYAPRLYKSTLIMYFCLFLFLSKSVHIYQLTESTS